MPKGLKKFLFDLPFYIIIFSFVLLVLGITATVFIGSLSLNWRDTFLPDDFSFRFLRAAWSRYQIGFYYNITFRVITTATVLSLVCSIPTSYVLARRKLRFKNVLAQFFRLPILLPELIVAVPLAVMFFSIGLAQTFWGVTSILMVIGIPFGLSILVPFIESMDVRVETAAETLGATRLKVFIYIIIPQLIPGIVTTMINVFVRLFTNFTFILLIGGPTTFTLTVQVFSVLENARHEPQAELNSLMIFYMLPMLVFTVTALVLERILRKRFGGR